MKKLNQQGFHHILMIILVVVVLGGVGFAAWYVWDKNKDNTDLQESSNVTQQAASTVTTELPSLSSGVSSATATESPDALTEDATEGWETYTNSYYGYSLKYPQDWMILNDDERSVCLQDTESGQNEPIIQMPGITPARNTTNADLCLGEIDSYLSHLVGITKTMQMQHDLDLLDLTGINIQGFASTYYCLLQFYPQASVNTGNEIINSNAGQIYVSNCQLTRSDGYTFTYSKAFYVNNGLLYDFSLKDNASEGEKNIYRLVLSTFSLN